MNSINGCIKIPKTAGYIRQKWGNHSRSCKFFMYNFPGPIKRGAARGPPEGSWGHCAPEHGQPVVFMDVPPGSSSQHGTSPPTPLLPDFEDCRKALSKQLPMYPAPPAIGPSGSCPGGICTRKHSGLSLHTIRYPTISWFRM